MMGKVTGFRHLLLHKAAATVHNQNHQTSKIGLCVRSDRCDKSTAVLGEAGRNHCYQFAQANRESLAVCSYLTMVPPFAQASVQPRSRVLVPQRKGPAAPR